MLEKLTIKNLKKIRDFEMDFRAGVYLVTADNEFGKTTMLNAIFMLLTGERSHNLLTKGADKGFVEGEFEENGKRYRVTIKFTVKNTRGKLTIVDLDSKEEYTSKSALEEIFGYNNFDVTEFIELSRTKPGRRKQVNFIKSLLPDEAQKQIDDIDTTIDELIPKREQATNRVNTQTAIVDNSDITEEDQEEYTDEIKLDKLRNEIHKASKRNEDIAGIKSKYDERQKKLDDWDNYFAKQIKLYQKASTDASKEVAELERKLAAAQKKEEKAIKDLERQQAALNKERAKDAETQEKHAKWLQKNKTVDLTEKNKELEQAINHNAMVEKVDEYNVDCSTLKSFIQDHADIVKQIDDLKADRVKIIESNELPVPGLTFDDQQLYLNGIPFMETEVSTSQIMETCLKLLIALNPQCKIFKVGNTNLLGENRFNEIIEFAHKYGYQGFLEEVVRGQKELNVFEYTANE